MRATAKRPSLASGETSVPNSAHESGVSEPPKHWQPADQPTARVRPLFEEHANLSREADELSGRSVRCALRMPQIAYQIHREGTAHDIALFRQQNPPLLNKGTYSQYTTLGFHADRLLALEITVGDRMVAVRDHLPPFWTSIYEVVDLTDDQFAHLILNRALRRDASRTELRNAVGRIKTRPEQAGEAEIGDDVATTPEQCGLMSGEVHCFMRITPYANLPPHRRKELESVLMPQIRALGYGAGPMKPQRYELSEWAKQARADVDGLAEQHPDDSGWLRAVAARFAFTSDRRFDKVIEKLTTSLKGLAAKALKDDRTGHAANTDLLVVRPNEGLYAGITPDAVRRLAAADQDEPRMSLLRYAREIAKVSDEVLADEILYFIEAVHNSIGDGV